MHIVIILLIIIIIILLFGREGFWDGLGLMFKGLLILVAIGIIGIILLLLMLD